MSTEQYSRRQLLKGGAGVATAGLATTAVTGGASAQEYGGYLDPVPNYEGVTADATGMEMITVTVGAGGDGLTYDPPAVVVDPGTVVEFEWTGAGGAHNVEEDASADERTLYSGEAVDTTGVEYTFEPTEDDVGVYPYYCAPHRGLEMKGVLVVGEENVEGDTFPYGEGDDGLRMGAIFGGSAVFGGVALLGVGVYNELYGDN